MGGYLVCDKCNEYYELQRGELPADFTNKCNCGGTLRFVNNIAFSVQTIKFWACFWGWSLAIIIQNKVYCYTMVNGLWCVFNEDVWYG